MRLFMLWRSRSQGQVRQEEAERRGERQEAESAVSQTGWTGRLSLYRLITWSPRQTCRDGRFLSPSRREFFLKLLGFLIKFLGFRMKTFVTENEKTDHLLNSPPDKRINPWLDKVMENFKIWFFNVLKTLMEMKSIGKRILTFEMKYW